MVYVPERLLAIAEAVDLAELCITSAATVSAADPPETAFRLPDVADIAVVVMPADGVHTLLAGFARGRPRRTSR